MSSGGCELPIPHFCSGRLAVWQSGSLVPEDRRGESAVAVPEGEEVRESSRPVGQFTSSCLRMGCDTARWRGARPRGRSNQRKGESGQEAKMETRKKKGKRKTRQAAEGKGLRRPNDAKRRRLETPAEKNRAESRRCAVAFAPTQPRCQTSRLELGRIPLRCMEYFRVGRRK